MQDASRDLFTYTVKCIQIRRKLRIEKRQQVGCPAPGSSSSRRGVRPRGATAWPCPAVPRAPRSASFLCGRQTPVEQRVLGARGRAPTQASPGALLGTRAGVCRAGLVAGRADRPGRPGLTPPAPPAPAAQENLLLSVLPAHISMGMKLTIIERLKEREDRRYTPDNNFHSLYIKRHQNVRWPGGGACVHGVSRGPGPAAPLPSRLEPQPQPTQGSARGKSRLLAGPVSPVLPQGRDPPGRCWRRSGSPDSRGSHKRG